MFKTAMAALGIAATLASTGAIYPTAMEVTDVNYQTNVVTLETRTGFTYEMEGTEDWIVGDIAALVMWSNGTTDITDDVILSSRYSGWTF